VTGTDGVPGVVGDLFRRSAGEITAVLLRRFGVERLHLVEECLQEAFVEALRRWPFKGTPARPRGWLYRVAERRMLDRVREEGRREELLAGSSMDAEGAAEESAAPALPGSVTDVQLALLLLCASSALGGMDRVVLTLNIGCGFSAREIAGALLASPGAVAQRIVRAKRRLRRAGVDLPDPTEDLLRERGPVLREVLYLLFSGGHSALGGEALVRAELCAEALRLVRCMLRHAGGEDPATRALAALMCFHAARLPARIDQRGHLVPLDAQDRSLWDQSLVSEGFHHLARARAGETVTRYHLEAGIAALHAAAPGPGSTDWGGLLALYDRLLEARPSPVIQLNRAVVVGRLLGPSAGLRAAREAASDPLLAGYHLAPAVLGAFLRELGHSEDARRAFRAAAALAPTTVERNYLEAAAQAEGGADLPGNPSADALPGGFGLG